MSGLSFTKLFKSILESTLWVQQPNHVRVTWITMLAMADSDGMVASSIPGLAARARVTVEECEEALKVFLSPDKYSRTPDHEGRRIREIKGGWELLNYECHRRQIAKEQNRHRSREYMRKHRAKVSAGVAPSLDQHPTCNGDVDERSDFHSLSSSPSSSKSSDPDPDRARETTGDLGPVDYGHLKPSKRELATPGAQPVLRHKFRPDWKPKKRHRLRGEELGLTEQEILDRADDARLKVHKQGFDNEDDHFMRELAWEARDKETRKFKEQSYANRRDFEQPGHDRG